MITMVYKRKNICSHFAFLILFVGLLEQRPMATLRRLLQVAHAQKLKLVHLNLHNAYVCVNSAPNFR